MSEHTFDLEITAAWTAFGTRLSRYITAMQDNDTLVVESQHDSQDNLDYAPACIQFFAWDQTRIRCEVPSNQFLHPLRMLEPEDHESLIGWGFNRPDQCEHDNTGNGSLSFYIDVDRSRPDGVVAQALRVLGDMWSIAHPSFLGVRVSGREDIPAFDNGQTNASEYDSLNELVDNALGRLLDYTPERDDDGDIPLVRGEQITYIRVLEDDQYVEVFSRVVHSIPDMNHAALVLSQLNRQWPTIKLILVEQSVLGVARVDAAPFAPDHLLRTIRSFAELADASDELAEELGGQPIRADGELFSTDESDSDGLNAVFDGSSVEWHDCNEFPPALMSILELDADVTGGLTPDDVAEICGRDRDTILEYLRISQEQEAEWHNALTNAVAVGGEDIELCTGEKLAWTQAIAHLRQALRVVVLPRKGSGTQ
ncbi:YbjN domain-containing protein [Rhodococcus sp. NPDC056743]|uniref:T3SS (YopN, CesT) and YbjN peptide-binding chaperone 1 n=1 Tax=Rhodococcus sp. NPDC056743 TaxID=3345934 RepID=UPI00366B2985